MGKRIVGLLDICISMVITGIFVLVSGAGLVLCRFGKAPSKNIKKIVQLYIGIIDLRDSVLSSYRNDVLLDGFIGKAIYYHFDFEKDKDEDVRLGDNIKMRIASVHPDNAITRAGFRKTAACLVEIRTFLSMLGSARKEGVNIIRAQDPHLLGFNAYLLSRLIKAPFIIQICSNYEVKDRQAKGLTFRPFVFKGVERWFERAIMRSSDLVLTDREHYRDFGLIPKDIPDNRYGNMGFFVSAAHYAPPLSRRDLRSELNIPPDRKVILYAGRLEAVKYPLDLIKMFALCLGKRRDLSLVIAGDGALRNEMEKMAREGGFQESVIFLKKLAQDKLVGLYNTADVVCFTSAGFTMIEAALAARCIVAYDFEWHSEFIGKDERGVLVRFGDIGEFAEKVLGALADPDLRERMGASARAYAIANYSREAAIKKETNFYKKVFERRGYALEKAI